MRKAYSNHQQRARHSDIPFKFSFDEWVQWWRRHLGPDWLTMRGCRAGQYVMARFGDKGPYHPDNVKCVTCGQNNSEARHLTGEDHYWVKLTAAQAAEARALYVPHSREFGTRALAKRYGIGNAAMAKCLRGKTWRMIDGPIAAKSGRMRKLTWDSVVEARWLYVPGHPDRSAGALARQYGVSTGTMWEIVTGKTWRAAPAQYGD